MSHSRAWRHPSLAALVCLAAVFSGCPANDAKLKDDCGLESEENCLRVHVASFDSLGRLSVDVFPLPEPTYVDGNDLLPHDTTGARDQIDRQKTYLDLEALEGDTLIFVILTDDLTLPTFPEPDFRTASNAPVNVRALRESGNLAAELLERRRADSAPVTAGLDAADFELVEQFWLVNAFLGRANRAAIARILKHPRVLYVDALPSDASPLPDSSIRKLNHSIFEALRSKSDGEGPSVESGRKLIGSDEYFRVPELRGGWVGLLDTGVNENHVLFRIPSNIHRRGDCVHGGRTCLEVGPRFDPGEACGNLPHATSSAGILTGNSNMGESYRGVTSVLLDSWRIIECRNAQQPYTNLNFVAAVRGFQAAVRSLDKIILGEVQGAPFDCPALGFDYCRPDSTNAQNLATMSFRHGMLSHAADRAFDAGAVVVSAIGNADGQPSQPGNGHRVLAVGAVDVETVSPLTNLGRGPMPDGRIKPDVVAPTNTRTANGLASVWLDAHKFTSGAAPFAAGAAALFRNFLKLTASPDTAGWAMRSIDPGHVYAQMILSGENIWPNMSDTTGAGLIRMPPLTGRFFWGKAVLDSSGAQVDIPLGDISTGSSSSGMPNTLYTIDAALWWPETYGQPHSFVSLRLTSAASPITFKSIDSLSVFQRTRGVWQDSSAVPGLRIRAENISDGPQVVYWSAHARFNAERDRK